MQRARRVVLGLGSNLGAREETIRSAVRALRKLPWVNELHTSPLYETDPVGGPPQDKYINAAVVIYTDATARTVLDAAMRIERDHGRERRERFGPRTLDVDVLWIEDEQVGEEDLQVPHPRLTERAFALLPLLDVAPDATDPRSGRPFSSYVSRVRRQGVQRLGAVGLESTVG